MSNLSVKRQRANTNGDAAAIPSKSPEEYQKIIATFDESTLRDLLLLAATNSSQLAALVVARRNDIIKAGNARAIDRVQESEMDLESVGKTTPAKKAHNDRVTVHVRDM